MDEIEQFFSRKQTRFESLSKDILVQNCELMSQELQKLVKENYELRGQAITAEQLQFVIDDQIESLRDLHFGRKSERLDIIDPEEEDKKEEPKPRKPRSQKPSERYPNIPVIEKIITQSPPPSCQCCGTEMCDSGMTEDSEQLTVIPKRYEIVLQRRTKYACKCCHGDLQTAQAPARIKEGSTYSNEMIIDVVLSKYCDLIPMNRYAAMAGRSGLINLPPHSLIDSTHYFAEFVAGVYQKIKDKVFSSRVLHADETPHRMLEGDDTKSWQLWGFSTREACYFECHDTRSGDVASDVLINSQCEILISDVYSGYSKATRVANDARMRDNKPFIKNAYCNAHARRNFFQARKRHATHALFYLSKFQKIYRIERDTKGKSSSEILKLREQIKSHFEEMKAQAEKEVNLYPEKHKFTQSLNYFLGNYEGLTLFLTDPEVAIDNNQQERLLRSHVIGRKTWYGTHSKKGAETAAILFTIVESCKLIGVNPRKYFKNLVQDLLYGKKPYTPNEYKELNKI
jgi:transposase